MARLPIYDVNHPYLRTRASKVSRVSPAERRVLDDMVETMRAAEGIGLAGPQVGIQLRLIVLEVDDELYKLVNPEILDSSDETDVREEGCLSLPNYYGPVERPVRVTVRAQDPSGKKVKLKADDWLARVLQHEIDHLDGILFFDPGRMRDIKDLRYRSPEEIVAENEADEERDRQQAASEEEESAAA